MSESKKPPDAASAIEKVEKGMDKTKKPETQSIDPELDIMSPRFNPLKALYAPADHLPVENAPCYNNLAHYESAMKLQQQRQLSGDSSVSE